MAEILHPSIVFLASLSIGGAFLLAVLFRKSNKEFQRGEQRLAELAQLSHLESRQFWARDQRFWRESEKFWKDHEKFWERADKRWADHELFMRMILQRSDRGRGDAQHG